MNMKEPRIYGSRWDKARLTFLRANPLCVMCHRQGRAVPATVVDHIKPHKLKEALNGGNPQEIAKAQKLFWDKANWQPLCKQHHDSTKQRIEKRGHVIGCDENGMPLDPSSHWLN
ncbi:HNH endonuclease [Cronobacter turicensis]|nr:HNH endonuclease [Cronobacter turicensis]EMA1789678.1 HNH endonuclease [Cronobacter turicensis]EMA1799432.1 HNH endonuclease [Cronobacter turicensis]EMA1847894.1 HNH endonuclease [Cronobacter turicensis]EMA1857203.1 HNH endonuclease [Cronobacter turicensis]